MPMCSRNTASFNVIADGTFITRFTKMSPGILKRPVEERIAVSLASAAFAFAFGAHMAVTSADPVKNSLVSRSASIELCDFAI